MAVSTLSGDECVCARYVSTPDACRVENLRHLYMARSNCCDFEMFTARGIYWYWWFRSFTLILDDAKNCCNSKQGRLCSTNKCFFFQKVLFSFFVIINLYYKINFGANFDLKATRQVLFLIFCKAKDPNFAGFSNYPRRNYFSWFLAWRMKLKWGNSNIAYVPQSQYI